MANSSGDPDAAASVGEWAGTGQFPPARSDAARQAVGEWAGTGEFPRARAVAARQAVGERAGTGESSTGHRSCVDVGNSGWLASQAASWQAHGGVCMRWTCALLYAASRGCWCLEILVEGQ